MADTFGPEIVNLFGASYGREAAANDSINAELESKRANAMAQRGQGLQSMFNVKKGEAMLPFDLAEAKAKADPELLGANKDRTIAESKMKQREAQRMIDAIPAEQFTQAALTQMAQTKSLMTSVVTAIQGGASVDQAVNSALSSLPPEMKKKLMADPAFGEQLAAWTSQTNPDRAVQMMTNGINGINTQMANFDPETWRTIVKENMATDRNEADNRSRERIADKEIAQRSSSSRESSLSTDKNLVTASEQRYPMPPNATPKQRNQILDLRQQWISRHKVASIPGFASSGKRKGMSFGPDGVEQWEDVDKTPQAASAPQPQRARPQQAPAADKFSVGKTYQDAKGNKAIYKGNGKWEGVK